jgi:histidinol phosphatase-like enzyme
LQAARDLGIDVSASVVVGDRWLDVEFGRALGTRTVLVRTGYARDDDVRPDGSVSADQVVDNLMEAASWVLRWRRATGAPDASG